MYFSFAYLIGSLVQLHLRKQFRHVLWRPCSSFWKQHSKLLDKFLSSREKQFKNEN